MPRRWTPIEWKYLGEYIVERLVGARVVQRYRLGHTPEEIRRRYGLDYADRSYKPWLRWADAVAFYKDHIVVIEAKVRNPMKGVYDLDVYRDLVPETPELARWPSTQVKYRLVAPLEDPIVRKKADSLGIEYEVFPKEWVLDLLV